MFVMLMNKNRHGWHLTDLVTHVHCFSGTSNIVRYLFFPPGTALQNVHPLFLCIHPLKRNKHTPIPFFFCPEDDWFTIHVDKQEQVYLKLNVCPSLWYLLICLWNKWMEVLLFLLFSHWAHESLTFIIDVHLICCTQLYYQSNGHVVHCKILYIESILNVF